MGSLLVLLGRRDEARKAHEQSRTIREPLGAHNAAVPKYLFDLASSHMAIGELARDLGDLPAALESSKQALTQASTMPEAPAKFVKRVALRLQAQVWSRLGQHSEALEHWKSAIEMADPASVRLLRTRPSGRANSQRRYERHRSGGQDGRRCQRRARSAHRSCPCFRNCQRVKTTLPKHSACSSAAGDAGTSKTPARLDAIRIDFDFAEISKRPEFVAWADGLKPK